MAFGKKKQGQTKERGMPKVQFESTVDAIVKVGGRWLVDIWTEVGRIGAIVGH